MSQPAAEAPAGFRERFQQRFGTAPERVPQAIALHEALGLSLFVGMWVLCFRVQPTRTLLGYPAVRARLGRLVALGEARVQRLQQSGWYAAVERGCSRHTSVDPFRLSSALGESVVVRRLLAPITVPAKLLITYQLVRRLDHAPDQVV